MADADASLDPAEQTVILSNLAEHCQRYDDMCEQMKKRVRLGKQLNSEERNLLSAAYKGALAPRRHAVRVATSIEKQEEADARTINAAMAAGYRSKVGTELQKICTEVQALLTQLLGKCDIGEPLAFYKKMQGDYFRYLAEYQDACQLGAEEATTSASEAYAAAMAEASTHLLPTHPLRLGLALNYSVFQHEVLQDTEAALTTARDAVKQASCSLEGMPQEAVRDAHENIMLLEDNIIEWDPNGMIDTDPLNKK
eukprot:TRINITY_DN26614_c0_g1_i1.p1 TRINITY_DN26614_c0_g1~~TRINITY_DN26614_c0_g1_i1.p1  ORF type:complete len:262 (-),score=73.66 TRINITY_DN26614_c0_g1_i1:98-859(-)